MLLIKYFYGQAHFYRFLGPLYTKNLGKMRKKAQKLIFQAFVVILTCEKFDLKALFWCSLGPQWGIGICKVVFECLFVFSRQLEGSKMTSTKICHFGSDIYKVNEALNDEAYWNPQLSTFLVFQCIFLTNQVKLMGKSTGQVAPTSLVHFGPP